MELELKKLTKEFQGFKAVDDITLTMSNGVYGLLGVNGAQIYRQKLLNS